MLALAVVCALVLAPPLRLYVQQQQDIAVLQGEIAQRTDEVDRLETEVGLWGDDAYVAAQARERLNFVRPGEIGYRVPDPAPSTEDVAVPTMSSDGTTSLDEDDVAALTRPDAAPEGTWYDRLWSSVEAVGTGTVDPVLDVPAVGGPVLEEPGG